MDHMQLLCNTRVSMCVYCSVITFWIPPHYDQYHYLMEQDIDDNDSQPINTLDGSLWTLLQTSF